MQFLILNSDYPAFLGDLYASNPGLEERSFKEQLETRMSTLFGVADFYSYNLRALGHEAHDVLINNEYLQRAWAREYGSAPPPLSARAAATARVVRIAGRGMRMTSLARMEHVLRRRLRPLIPAHSWVHEILEQQIEHFRPDVILNQDIGLVDSDFLHRMRTHYGLLIGQIASPLPTNQDFGRYDLMLSSLPTIVHQFRHLGVSAELHRLAFEPRVLQAVEKEPRTITCSFVGSISPDHTERLRLLEELSRRTPIEIWGTGIDTIRGRSSLRGRYRGPAWGRDMYQILARSQITVNKHLDISENYANNMRLYEATGMGALLLTDAKDDLDDLLAAGSEVTVYRTPDECVELLMHFASHSEEREKIAAAGQRRSLTEHTYARRMTELVSIVERYA